MPQGKIRRLFLTATLSIFMIILGAVGSTFAAIAVDGTATNSSSNTSTVSWSHTVGAGSNRLLVVGVSIDARNSNTVSSVTYGAASLTMLRSEGTAASNARTEIWYLLAPASGTDTITVTIGGTAPGTLNMAGAVSYTGVDQTTPFSSNNGAAGANATTPYVSVSSATGNLVFDIFATYRPATIPAKGAGQTLYWKNTTNGNTGVNGGMSSKPGSAATSMTWSGRATTGTGNVWSISAASIKAAAGAPVISTTPPTVTSTTPANLATGVALNSSVTIMWSKNIDCTTVNATNITSTSPGWTLSSCATNKAVFATSGQANSTAYSVTVSTGVKDTAGNAMAANYAFSYTTAAFVACVDADGDGYGANGSPSCPKGTAIDCNDNDPTVYPGAPLLCDGKDNNCDGRRDFTTDVDQDQDGILWCAGDCNDLDATIYPGAPEICDGKDNNCDRIIPANEADSDKDGYRLCSVPPDCNDNDASINPGMPEVCGDGKDNNCNGVIDETPCACPDFDKDGFTASYCGGTDCNDSDANVHPGAVEICTDGIDNDCNGLIDRKDPGAVNCPICTDKDGDGYAIEGGACGIIDCNDNDSTVYPGAPRLCDGKDNDCDGRLDFTTDVDQDHDGVLWCAGDCNDLDPAINTSTVWFKDSDNDGYSDGITKTQCLTPQGYKLASQLLATSGDCNDSDPAANPGLPEFCGDRKDNNCNGQIDEAGCVCPDFDHDGFTASYCGGADCNDSDPNVHPGVVEICTDGIDNDCNGLIDRADPGAVNCPVCIDNDGDGYAVDGGACGPVDCDDNDPKVYPGAPRICDGKDNDCDGRQDFTTDVDADLDGYPVCAGDCNDNNPNVNPGKKEGHFGDPTCSDGLDNDCDGKIDAQDPGCFAPVCGTKTSPKDGPHFFTLLNPDGTTNLDDGKLTCGKCHDANDFLNSQKNQCQRCHADPNDTSDPLNGVLKAQYPLAPPYGFGTAPNVKLHSSTILGKRYGNWTTSCITCHNPHQEEQNNAYKTTYGKYIKEYVCFNNPVTGLNAGEFITFTAATGTGSFADGAPHNENICEMCHMQTNHHRRDGTAPGDISAGAYVGHYDGVKCTECHSHNEGFKPVCGTCHDVPPPTGTHLKHFSGTKDNAEYGSTSIAQDVTAQAPGYLFNCGNCHPLDITRHMNGATNSGGGDAEIELYNPDAPAGSIKSLNPPTATYTPGTTVYVDSKGKKYTVGGTCDNVYCHSGPEYATTQPVSDPAPTPGTIYPLIYNPPWESLVVQTRQYKSPKWGVDSFGCNGCHGYPITNQYPTVSAGTGDTHAWIDDFGYLNLHMWNMSFDPLQCNVCHYNTVRDDYLWARDTTSIQLGNISIFNSSKHVNGAKDVAFTPIPVVYHKVNGDVFKNLSTASFNPDTKTCSNVACHQKQTQVKWGSPYRWWVGFECNTCHRK